jgi:hypothetical protein
MNPEQVKAILRYLAQASAKKLLKWQLTQDDEFQVSFPKSAVVCGFRESPIGEMAAIFNDPPGPYLDFFNSNGVKILHLNAATIKRFDMNPALLKAIYDHAKNQVFRYDETFEDILNSLPNHIKQEADQGSK